MQDANMERRTQTLCLITLTSIAVVASLHWLKPVVVPFVWALFFSSILVPATDYLHKKGRIPRPIAIGVTFLIALVIVAIVGGIIASSVSHFAADAAQYEGGVERFVKKLTDSKLLEHFGIPISEDVDLISLIPSGTMKGVFLALTNLMTTILSRGLVVMIFCIFLIVGASAQEKPVPGFVGEIETGVKQYISAKVTLSAITAVLVTAVLFVLGVPYAISFGAFAFILNFIPNIGSLVSTILPLPVLLFTPGFSTVTLVLAIAIPGAIQTVVGNVIEPRLMGKSLDLHPITVLLALMFWGMVWGFEGMILAVPITSVVKIAFEKIEATRSVALLMAGRFESVQESGNDTL